jgi:hypothetical protein
MDYYTRWMLSVLFYPKVMCACLHSGNFCIPNPIIGNLALILATGFYDSFVGLLPYLFMVLLLAIIAFMLEFYLDHKSFMVKNVFLRGLSIFVLSMLFTLFIDWLVTNWFIPICYAIE